MSKFRDKTVIITGASAGVGVATAGVFFDAGAKLVLAARGIEALQAAAAPFGDRAYIMAMDVADESGCERLLQSAEERFGAVHVLVNNAGCNYRGSVTDFAPAQLAQIVDVNLRAPIVLSRLAIPLLRRAGGGAIVNVASIAGKIPVPFGATYSATKFGLRAFSRALAEELRGSGVTVSCVSPGPVETRFIMDNLDDVPDYYFSQPVSSPRAVADAILACALDGKVERTLPASTGALATAGYLVPALARVLRPALARKGARVKERYRRKYRG